MNEYSRASRAQGTLPMQKTYTCHSCVATVRSCRVDQCGVTLQHFQGCYPEIRREYSKLLPMIGPVDPILPWCGRAMLSVPQLAQRPCSHFCCMTCSTCVLHRAHVKLRQGSCGTANSRPLTTISSFCKSLQDPGEFWQSTGLNPVVLPLYHWIATM